MNTLKIKICGMRDTGNIASVAALSPDYLGFIEYSRSPRFVGEKFAVPAESVPAYISRVGVFVDADYALLKERSGRSGYDAVQLHGFETPDYCARVRDDGFRVIKVFRVDEAFDFAETSAYIGHVDLVLFDARGRQPGGNGIRFDWQVLRKYHQEIPFFLSGGLQPETLTEDLDHLRGMNLYGVDLNSGVETEPGFKDRDKVASAINQVRQWK